VEEEALTGDIKFKDYQELFKYSSGNCGILIYLILSVMTCIMQLVPSYVLAYWTALPYEEQ
jgi:hypothetical protein